MSFRDEIKKYADEHWAVPCADGVVWVYYGPINTRAAAAAQKQKTGKEWAAAFLQYPDPKFGAVEGLYLIPAGDISRVKAGEFDVNKYPNRVMLSSWFDAKDKDGKNAEVLSQKPQDHGLNDCAHFVTQSLAAGNIHVETTGVPTLYNSLRARDDTKTLANTVAKAEAERIIDAKIMKPGDVIIYSKGKDHHHSVVYMGDGTIAMHTWANHPKHPTIKGDWKPSVSDDHPLVTLLHFGSDDIISAGSGMLGWWTVQWRGGTYYYFFDKSGRVSWSQQKPGNTKQPMNGAKGKGYWFEDPTRVAICWSETGSLETFTVKPPKAETHIEGLWNKSEKLIADKMA